MYNSCMQYMKKHTDLELCLHILNLASLPLHLKCQHSWILFLWLLSMPSSRSLSLSAISPSGFMTERHRSAGFIRVFSFKCCATLVAYQHWNFDLRESLMGLFTLTFSGCSQSVQCDGTCTTLKLLASRKLRNLLVSWPLKWSKMTKAGWLVDKLYSFLVLWT